MKTGEHGPDKIFDKFTVVKSKHVRPQRGPEFQPEKSFEVKDELTNKDEFIFVLRPETNDKAAIAALVFYANLIEKTYPTLSRQILEKLKEIEQRYPEGNPALCNHPTCRES